MISAKSRQVALSWDLSSVITQQHSINLLVGRIGHFPPSRSFLRCSSARIPMHTDMSYMHVDFDACLDRWVVHCVPGQHQLLARLGTPITRLKV